MRGLKWVEERREWARARGVGWVGVEIEQTGGVGQKNRQGRV